MTGKKGKILVVDDESGMRKFLSIMLKKEGHQVELAEEGSQALEKLKQDNFDVVITDLKMQGMDGINLLQRIREVDNRVIVIVITAFSTWDNAVEAMRLGAYDYLKKPFDNETIKHSISRAIIARRLYETEDDNEEKILQFDNLIGNSQAIQDVRKLIRRIGPTDSTILIQGASGTGKELVARALHSNSLRSHEAFIAVNCGAFTETLLQSELFGHVRGAFTGAVVQKKGLFEVADKGTFFLDEVAEMSKETQAKLLRALEEKAVMPVGGTKKINIDTRIIAATNKNLEEEVKKGNFREDLFYRLNVIPIHIPPLRERKEDIPLLVGHFIAKYSHSMKRNIQSVSKDGLDLLVGYEWPGNVRELDNVLQRAVALCEGEIIEVSDLTFRIRTSTPGSKLLQNTRIPDEGMDLEKYLEEIEKNHIKMALEKTGNNITNAAKLLKMSFRSIRYKIKKLKIATD